MKKYKGSRKYDEICNDMKSKGLRVDSNDFDRGGEFVYFKGAWHGHPWTIAYNTCNGHFFVYNGFTGAQVATHMSTELDNEPWYMDLMDTLYEKESNTEN